MISSLRPDHWRALALGLLLAGLSALAVAIALEDSSGRVSLQGVPASALAESGITLTAPGPGETANVSSEEARITAGVAPGSLREVVLTHLAAAHQVPPIDRLVWAFNLDPRAVALSSGPAGNSPIIGYYGVAFVDAQTGQFQLRWGAGGPPSETITPAPASPRRGGANTLGVSNFAPFPAVVVPWKGAEPILLQCGQSTIIGPADGPGGFWDMLITNAETGETIIQRTTWGQFYVTISAHGVLTGNGPGIGPAQELPTCPPG